jgi:hypothetical protein
MKIWRTPIVKDLIKNLIFEYDIVMPKKIFMKIKFEIIELAKGENLPSLKILSEICDAN